MRAALAAESAGIPSVSIVCDGFLGQATATARGHGFDNISIAVTVGHVDAQSVEEMTSHFLTETVDQIVQGLTIEAASVDGTDFSGEAAEPTALDVVVSGTIDEVHEHFVDRGWTDSHPFIPPTQDRVEAFIADSGHDPWKTLGVAASSGRDLTIWSIAVNGVMAGCRPEHLPVLIAMTEILADPSYGAEHSGNTTGADAIVVLDGPNSAALGFNHGAGVMREGSHANTSVGRWLRLYLRNVFGFTADAHDKATFGNPTRPVLAEDMECLTEIGWTTLAEDLVVADGPVNVGSRPAVPSEKLTIAEGFVNVGSRPEVPSEDTVSMARMNSGTIIGSVFGSTPEEVVPYLANGIVRTAAWDLTHVYGLGHHQFQPLLVISPLIARLFAAADWSKAEVQTALFAHARLPASTFEKFIGEWSNLTAGRRTLTELVDAGELPSVFAESDDPNRLVPVVGDSAQLLIAVAGDPTRANAYALSNDGPHGWWTTKTIDHTPASDLICQI